MKKQEEISEIRDRFTDDEHGATSGTETTAALRALGALAAAFVITVAAGVLFAGCGSHADSEAQLNTSGGVSATEDGRSATVASAVPVRQPAQGGLSATDVAVREGLPPDLSVSTMDTLVTPGQAVAFVIEGTPDVAEVALSDGRDDPMPLVRDAGTNTWRTQYRVPLHPKHERFGVSVTAKTEANRWRRVWVFLHVNAADSTTAGVEPGDVEEPVR